MKDIMLQMTNICKSFVGVQALSDVDLYIEKGEIHALVGENGAGKSTLIKILTGIYKKDSGKIVLDGKELNPVSSIQVQHEGISTVYQELNLLPNLSVAENIYIAREPKKKNGFIDWEIVYSKSRQCLDELGLQDIDVHRKLGTYGTAVQQMTAIVKAVTADCKLLIMDEPTSSLDKNETKEVLRVMTQLRDRGVSILFVSHRLDEIFEICDSVTVLKDGHHIARHKVADITKYQLITEMIGREASTLDTTRKPFDSSVQGTEELFRAEEIASGPQMSNVSFSIRKGEVVGLAGLLGSGRTETTRACFGVDKLIRGKLYFQGKEKNFKSPKDSIALGFALCPEDRKVEALFPDMSVSENISIVLLPKLSKMGIVDSNKQKKIVDEYIKLLKIKTPNEKQPVRFLSGGNQQKVILARWLCANSELIMLDEPTRGIDVGAKGEIEKLIQKLSSEGKSVLMISSEMEEEIRNCDRIYVMRDGETKAELNYAELSVDNILNIIANY